MLRRSYTRSLRDLASMSAFSKRTMAEEPLRSLSSLHITGMKHMRVRHSHQQPDPNECCAFSHGLLSQALKLGGVCS